MLGRQNPASLTRWRFASVRPVIHLPRNATSIRSCPRFRTSGPGWLIRVGGLFGVWIALAFLVAVAATNGPVRPAVDSQAIAAIQTRLTDAQADLARAVSVSGSGTNLPPGSTTAEVIEFRSSLQRLVRTYQSHLDDFAALEATRRRLDDLDHAVKAWTGPATPPPYSILQVDELRDAIQSLGSRIAAAETAREVLARFLSEAQANAKEAEEDIRRLSEKMEGTTEPPAIMQLSWQRKLAELRTRLAGANAAAYELRRQVVAEELVEHRQRLTFTHRQLAMASQHVIFPATDLEKVMASIDAERARLEEEIQRAEADLDARQRALNEARTELQNALARRLTPVAGTAAADTTAMTRLQAMVDLRSAQAQTGSQRLAALRLLIDGCGNNRLLWQMRSATFGSRNLAEIQAAYRRLERLNGLVQSAKPYFAVQLTLAANQIAEQQERLRNLSVTDADASLVPERLATFEERDEFYHRTLRSLEKTERLVMRWRESLDADREALPFTTRVRDLFTSFSSFATRLWRFELFVVEDTVTVDGQSITGRRGVTVGKVTVAILILVVGYWISNLVARVLERLAVSRLHIEANQANLIRRWARVVIVIGLVIFSLISVKIPLTVFAFAGGALAIGLGFGMQNLLKNFISGIIILFERPFRVGDVLDVGGQRGTVTTVGIRSSVLQRWDGTETLIPNSLLLETNVTNWTYSNRSVRFSLMVGVAYGSDTRRVSQILGEVADRHGLVLKQPPPQVLFLEFGDSALQFELRYWVDVVHSNAAQIGSDLRHMVGGAFAEHGIVIAFPQRDLRLRAEGPVQVQMIATPVPGPAAESPSAPPPGPPAASV